MNIPLCPFEHPQRLAPALTQRPEMLQKLHCEGKTPTHRRFLSQKSSLQMAAGVEKVFGEARSSLEAPYRVN